MSSKLLILLLACSITFTSKFFLFNSFFRYAITVKKRVPALDAGYAAVENHITFRARLRAAARMNSLMTFAAIVMFISPHTD